ncbi:MAG: chemotaxis protein CheC [Myxococcota bacterium]
MIDFSEDDYDVLREIANVAMGRAAADLAELLGVFVELTVPRLEVVSGDDLLVRLQDTAEKFDEVSAIRQSFTSAVDGEVITLFNQAVVSTVADLLGYEGRLDPAKEREVLLDVSNILVGACLNGMGGLMNTEMRFGAPSLLCEWMDVRRFLAKMFAPERLDWEYTLVIKIAFALEEREFKSDLLVFLSERSVGVVGASIESYLDNL